MWLLQPILAKGFGKEVGRLLEIKNVMMGYGDLKVLNNVSLTVNLGETVALVGSNGAGKTSLLRAISRLEPIWSGSIKWNDAELTQLKAHEIPLRRIAHVPQGRGILNTLSVADNLYLGAYIPEARAHSEQNLQKVLKLFPILAERLNQPAGTLSGGQQQMLAIGRALMLEPELMILDEPSLGLAPVVVETVFKIIQEINSNGVSILLIEQNLVEALKVSTRGYVLETGVIVMEGPAAELAANKNIQEVYLGL
jgi:branched-chain amino acid transport system ATP-binding protein